MSYKIMNRKYKGKPVNPTNYVKRRVHQGILPYNTFTNSYNLTLSHLLNSIKVRKAQMKIQEMAFVLLAIMLFFAIVGIIFLKISLSNFRENVETQRSDAANELIRGISGTPEFAWTATTDCDSCIDMDKVFVLKERKTYQGFWGLDYLMIETIYPAKTGECTRRNYPNCSTITFNQSNNIGITQSAYVALCRWEFKEQRYRKCELGRIYASGKALETTNAVK